MKTFSRDALARELGGDVHGAVADPDHQHALAVHVERVGGAEVVVGVDRLAVEAAREVRVARVPVVAVADDQEVELLRGAVLERDPPAALGLALGALDRGLEADPVAQRERVGVAPQVLLDLGVVGVVRVVLAHRHVAEADAVAGGVDVQRLVGRGAPVGVAEVPVAADVVAGLEARVGQAAVAQRLAGREPADAGSDHGWSSALPLGLVAGRQPVRRLDVGEEVEPDAIEELLGLGVEAEQLARPDQHAHRDQDRRRPPP